MMPVIRINDTTFADLKAISTWLGTKTPGDTIDRIVKQAMEELGLERDDGLNESVKISENGAMEFSSTPSLTFTKPLAAYINGKRVQNPRWSSILISMLSEIKGRGFDGEDLMKRVHVPTKLGKHENDGFRYHRSLGISVQGQSAPDVWKEVDRLAKEFDIPVSIEFWWRHNPKAQFPGKTGLLRSGS